MVTLIKSFAFFCLFCSLILYHFICLLFEMVFNFFGKRKNKENLTHLRAAKWAKSLFTLTPGWSVKILNKNYLPKDKTSLVIVANHESATDILAIYYLKMQFRWLAKKEAFKVPFIGIAMKWAGYIPVKRGNKESHKKALEACKETIARKVPVLFFPEGTRSTLGHPKEFKVGAFKIAKDMNVPVFPIVLKGAGKLLKKGSFAPNKAAITVKLLEPVTSPQEESIGDFAKRVENLIKKEHAKI